MIWDVRPPSRLGTLTLLLSILSLIGGFYLGRETIRFYNKEFPDVEVLKTHYPTIHYKGPKRPPEVTIESKPPNYWVRLSQISKDAIAAVVVSEDWAFYQHKGYDPNQISEAIKKDWKDNKFARGASTITQQVVRNVFLDQDKNFWRKIKEIFLATELENTAEKNRILEIYLNIAEWGEGFYGIGPAARYYFHKSPDLLNAKEGAFLAMLLPSPKRYGQSFRAKKLTNYAKATIESILTKMVKAHFLSEEEMTRQVSVPLSFENEQVKEVEKEVLSNE